VKLITAALVPTILLTLFAAWFFGQATQPVAGPVVATEVRLVAPDGREVGRWSYDAQKDAVVLDLSPLDRHASASLTATPEYAAVRADMRPAGNAATLTAYPDGGSVQSFKAHQATR
jgi:hypothetical protein